MQSGAKLDALTARQVLISFAGQITFCQPVSNHHSYRVGDVSAGAFEPELDHHELMTLVGAEVKAVLFVCARANGLENVVIR